MLYSNRMLKEGMVKLPTLPKDYVWNIEVAQDGEAFLTVNHVDGSFAGYATHLPQNADALVEGHDSMVRKSVQAVEYEAMSLRAYISYCEEKESQENEKEAFVKAFTVLMWATIFGRK